METSNIKIEKETPGDIQAHRIKAQIAARDAKNQANVVKGLFTAAFLANLQTNYSSVDLPISNIFRTIDNQEVTIEVGETVLVAKNQTIYKYDPLDLAANVNGFVKIVNLSFLPFYPEIDGEIGVTNTIYEYSDVRRFEAIGDGFTDSTLALRNAITSSVNIGNKIIDLRHGIYAIGQLEVNTDNALLSVPKEITLSNGSFKVVNNTNYDCAIYLQGTLKNFTLDQSSITNHNGRGEGIRMLENASIEDFIVIGERAIRTISLISAQSSNCIFVIGDDCSCRRGFIFDAAYAGIRHNGSERLKLEDIKIINYGVKGYVYNGNIFNEYGSVFIDGLHTDTDSTHTAGAGFLIDPGSTKRMRLAVLCNMNIDGYNDAASAKIEYCNRVIMKGENRFVTRGSVYSILVNYCGDWNVDYMLCEGFFAWNFGNGLANINHLILDYTYDFNGQIGSGDVRIKLLECIGGENFAIQYRDLDNDKSTKITIETAYLSGQTIETDLIGIQFTDFQPGDLTIGNIIFKGESQGRENLISDIIGNTLYEPRINRTPNQLARTFYATGPDRLDGLYLVGDKLFNAKVNEQTIPSGGGGWIISAICTKEGYAYRYIWNNTSDYLIANPVLASDGNVYRALLENGISTTIVDPTTDNGSNWELLGTAGIFRILEDVPLYIEQVWNPPAISTGQSTSLQIALTGITFNHKIWASFQPDSGNLATTISLSVRVESINVVRVILHNGSSGGADPGQGIIRVWGSLSR